jgi:5-dehydro-4-deoxyglucarate dehydratase
MLDEFFLPYLDIRNRKAGYAVSIVKAGARLVGQRGAHRAARMADLTAEEDAMLLALIKKQGAE